MEQADLYFRPPSEAESFIIRVMQGCSHNKCTFCNMYKGIPLTVLSLEEVLSGIERDARELGSRFLHRVTSLYLDGGDPLVLSTDMLLRILEHARAQFPALERVACYATARSIIRKTPEALKALSTAGLRRVYVGLESGLDAILSTTCKGCTRADLVRAGQALAKAGIENDVSIMLGIGGPELSELHAVSTASLLNAISPVCVRIRTFIPNTDTPMGNEYLQGRFILMDPFEILRELRLLAEHITTPMRLLSEHWSDFIRFDACLPEDRDGLFAAIDGALQWPRSAFRETGICGERH